MTLRNNNKNVERSSRCVPCEEEGCWLEVRLEQLTINKKWFFVVVIIWQLPYGLTNTRGMSIFNCLNPSSCDNQTVRFAPFCFDASVCCIPSKLWPHGRTVERRSEGAGMRCVGYWAPRCSGMFEWSLYFKHNVTTLCRSVCTCTPLHVELFICLQPFSQLKFKQNNDCFQSWDLMEGRKVPWSGKQSLTWHYLEEEPAISPKPLKRGG